MVGDVSMSSTNNSWNICVWCFVYVCCFIFVHGLLFVDLTWGRFFLIYFLHILLLSEKSLEICLYLWQRSVVLRWPFVLDRTLKTGYYNQWTLLPLLLRLLLRLLLLLTFLIIVLVLKHAWREYGSGSHSSTQLSASTHEIRWSDVCVLGNTHAHSAGCLRVPPR